MMSVNPPSAVPMGSAARLRTDRIARKGRPPRIRSSTIAPAAAWTAANTSIASTNSGGGHEPSPIVCDVANMKVTEPLDGDSAPGRITRRAKGHHERVAFRLHFEAAVGGDTGADLPVVVGEDLHPAVVAELDVEHRRAFDVGEEDGYRAVGSRSLLQVGALAADRRCEQVGAARRWIRCGAAATDTNRGSQPVDRIPTIRGPWSQPVVA